MKKKLIYVAIVAGFLAISAADSIADFFFPPPAPPAHHGLIMKAAE